jgi:PAS domain S-box-containing protein
MPELKTTRRAPDSSAARADELFKQHRQQIYRDTDKLFARLMVCQWLACIFMAVLIAPYTWEGQSTQIHIHVWAAFFIGGAITIFPVWMTYAWPGAVMTRHVVAVSQMLMSALLISLSGGRIETHFHVFGSLVILSFYRDWRVLIPATIVVALDHFLRGIYWPYSVYGVLTASPWRSIEHAGWVIFEDVFLVISCLRSVNEMRSIANRTAALEASEQSFRQIFEEAPIGMAVVGLDERFNQVNTTLCQMVGYSEEELKSRTPLDITYPGDRAGSKELAQAMLNGAERNSLEKRYLRKNGDVVWATRTGCVIRDGSGRTETCRRSATRSEGNSRSRQPREERVSFPHEP